MDYEVLRRNLVRSLVSRGYLSKKEVIEAMLHVPRHCFVPEYQKENSYVDSPLPIGLGQTISAPHMVAIMTENLEVKSDNKILEIGAGSGYQAAVLTELAKDGFIYTVERIQKLAEYARKNLEECGFRNVEVIAGDGTKGYAVKAPYDRIIVTAGSPGIPKALVDELRDSYGRMLIPVGGQIYQELTLVEKRDGKVLKTNLGGCMFVPLIGDEGW